MADGRARFEWWIISLTIPKSNTPPQTKTQPCGMHNITHHGQKTLLQHAAADDKIGFDVVQREKNRILVSGWSVGNGTTAPARVLIWLDTIISRTVGAYRGRRGV